MQSSLPVKIEARDQAASTDADTYTDSESTDLAAFEHPLSVSAPLAFSQLSSQLRTEGQSGMMPQPPDIDRSISAVLATLLLLFALVSSWDFWQFRTILWEPYIDVKSIKVRLGKGWASAVSERLTRGTSWPQSVSPRVMIVGLTFYRFYTGFLSATWLPYLLAMEGAELWRGNQALFMGVVKLLYGASIILNPFFGLLGDRAAAASHALGRRLFVRLGIILAGLGIFVCHFAAPRGCFITFLVGIVLWRLGEGLNDVTTEAICPELLPPEHFAVSSAVRAAMFLVGGLAGYVMVALCSHLHYSWLYHGYLILMLFCGLPALLLISDAPGRKPPKHKPLANSIIEAYVKPSQYVGGFPRACLCIFLFSFGSAPMFFLLLMLRDLVGISDPVTLQTNFSFISMDFFLSAALAAALNVLTAPKGSADTKRQGTQNESDNSSSSRELRSRSFDMTAASVFAFAVVVVLIPCIHLFPTFLGRRRFFYILAAFMGATFGSVYARFQDCNWQLLPQGVETATAMGYSTMCKLLGAGLGNFGAGLILDCFQASSSSGISLNGYIALCACSAFFVVLSGARVRTIPRKAVEVAA
jgi:MFS family permease